MIPQAEEINSINSENHKHLKNFRNVDCQVTNHSKVQDVSKPQKHKLITLAVCSFILSHLIGFFLATQ